jgi:hypothetical protein
MTGSEYIARLNSITVQHTACRNGVYAAFAAPFEALRRWRDDRKNQLEAANPPLPDLQAQLDALEQEYERRRHALEVQEDAQLAVCDDAAHNGREAALREARDTGGYIPMLIICAERLVATGQRIQRDGLNLFRNIPADDRILLIATSFDDLQSQIEVDRICITLVLVLPHVDGKVVLGRNRVSYTELERRWRNTARLDVWEVIHLMGGFAGPAPADGDAIGELLHCTDFVIAWTGLDTPEPKCYSAKPFAGPHYQDAMGIFAHAIVANDCETTLGLRRGQQLFVDDSFAGDINPLYVRFLLAHNRVSRVDAEVIRTTPISRPDLLIDDGVHKELEETKPDSASGRKKGPAQARAVRLWMTEFALPYKLGFTYRPTPEIPIFATVIVGYEIDFYLTVRRLRRGVIVYKYCIRADWEALTKTGVVRVIIMLLAYLLRNVGVIPLPPGRDPVPLPIPVPGPIPIPQPIPVPAQLETTIPRESLVVLRKLSAATREFAAASIDPPLPP